MVESVRGRRSRVGSFRSLLKKISLRFRAVERLESDGKGEKEQ